MRTLTKPLQDNLVLKKKAVEPLIVLGVQWTPGHEILYSDRKINGTTQAYPIINSMGNFDTSQTVSGSGSSQNVPVVLSDVEEGTYTGHLKDIVDNADIHKATARIYLMVQGVSLNDKTLLFQGKINSPLEWDEGDRTLSFDIYSELESVEAGFSIEDGDFPTVPDDLRGKPWPMVFGSICWEKTQRVRSPRKGFLNEPVGVVDFTLYERLCQARFITCAQKYEPPRTAPMPGAQEAPPGSLESYGCISFRDNKTGDKGCICPDLPFGTCPQPDTEEDKIDTDCLTRRLNEICRLLTRIEQQEATVVNPFEVRGGENFPQGQKIRLFIEGVIFIGTMTGTSFQWDEVIHPQREEIQNPPCKKVGEAKIGWRNSTPKEGWNRTQGNGRSFEYGGSPTTVTDCNNLNSEPQFKVVDGPGESWRYYELFEEADFIGLRAGSEVFLEDESEILHIANLFGGTVTGVAAYRTYGDTTLLTNLPTDYYTVRTTDYGAPYDNVVEIVINKPLKTYKDEEWEEDIYITMTSDVGPNPADVIKFLVDTYLATSNITMDSASYTSVKAKLTNYPVGCMITDRPTVFDLIGDIAYRSRCAAVVRDGKMVLIYLSEKPTPIRTLTMADIIPESVRITHSETDDLKTRHDIEWSQFGAPINQDDEAERRLLIKWNVPLYGIQEVKYDYYTQNTFETVQKSATFWMIREATTWKHIHFETPLTQIDLDVFDSIALNIPFFTTNITVLVEEANYDANSNTIKFKCWTPVRAGETNEYIWAWPAQQDSKEKFPLQGIDDGRSGDALGFSISPPLDHVLRGGFLPDDATVQTVGDNSPSDLDDVFPTLACPQAEDPNQEIRDPFDFDDFREIANRQDDHFENNQDSFGGGGGSTDEDNEQHVCGQPSLSDTCTYEVKVTSITPQAVAYTPGPPPNCGGPCGCGQSGRPCFGPTATQCHSFGALWAAQTFLDQKKAEAKLLFDECLYQCGQSNVWTSGSLKAIPGSAGYGGCEDVTKPGDPNAPGAGDGEISTPGDA